MRESGSKGTKGENRKRRKIRKEGRREEKRKEGGDDRGRTKDRKKERKTEGEKRAKEERMDGLFTLCNTPYAKLLWTLLLFLPVKIPSTVN